MLSADEIEFFESEMAEQKKAVAVKKPGAGKRARQPKKVVAFELNDDAADADTEDNNSQQPTQKPKVVAQKKAAAVPRKRKAGAEAGPESGNVSSIPKPPPKAAGKKPVVKKPRVKKEPAVKKVKKEQPSCFLESATRDELEIVLTEAVKECKTRQNVQFRAGATVMALGALLTLSSF